MPSPGFFEVRQTYSFDPARRQVESHPEVYIGLVIENLHALVEQNVFETVDGFSSEIARLPSEEHVIAWASSEADTIAEILRETKYPPPEIEDNDVLLRQWKDYVDRYVERWSKEFLDQVLHRWKLERSTDE